MESRMDYDGAGDRAAVLARLRSFDDAGMTGEAIADGAMALVDVAGAESPAAVLAWQVAGFRAAASAAPVPKRQVDLELADAVLENTFSFYGEAHALGPDIDWEHNPGTGHWGHDLNRFSYLYHLLQALRATGDRRYGEKMVALVLDWIQKTDVCDAFVRTTPTSTRPDKSRNVWSSYLNIAIHIEAWATTLPVALAAMPDLVTPAQWLRILKSLHEQLWYLDLVIPETTGNWVTIGTRGQLTVLSRIPGLRDTTELAATAFARIVEASAVQLLPDGSQYELTPHYHMVVVNNLDRALAAAEALPGEVPLALTELYERAVRYLPHLVTPDEKLVAFNDSDPDSGPQVGALMATPRARQALGELADAELTSRYFPDAGVMIMRQGSRHGREELYLAFDGGPFGYSHQHEDALGFWLSAYGRSFIVDPGRHLYDQTAASYRPYLMTTQAHSTITVDGGGQRSRAAGDRTTTWLATAPQAVQWQVAEDGGVVAQATYPHGYEGVDAAAGITHTRRFTFVPEPGYWLLDDTVAGQGTHRVTSRFQFMPGALRVEHGLVHTCHGDADLAIFYDPADWDTVTVLEGQETPRQGWYSDGYNKIAPAPMLVFQRDTALPFTARLTLVPYRHGVLPERP